ncbi:MAG: ABC transporter permease [Rhodobacteraceae bacterium]|nr:ABC transporter permease [Paracoccaceae bacterium]
MSSVADNAPSAATTRGTDAQSFIATVMPLLLQLRKLAWLLFAVTTLLFFTLRAAGDPALVLAGNDATPEQLAAIRAQFGLDRPLIVQYFSYMWNVLQFDFGKSLASGEPALEKVLGMMPRTLHLAVLALLSTAMIAVPLGAWLGFKPENPERRLVSGAVFILQGVPGFVTALLLIQVFAVNLRMLPSLGYEPADPKFWILPTASLASFLVPSLTRVVAANVAEAMREDYIRTARANGASQLTLLWRHAVPNALLGAAALLSVQFAFMLGGSAIIETIFSWPGLGWLLLESTQTLDFPVVQALAFCIAILVFTVNASMDLVFRYLDPRLRTKGA